MSKKHNDRGHGWEKTEAPAAVAEAPAPARYQVTLKAKTPLAHPTLEVEAASEEDAWAKFMTANGISGSDHDREIVRL